MAAPPRSLGERRSRGSDMEMGYDFDCGCVFFYDLKTGEVLVEPCTPGHKTLVEVMALGLQPGVP